VTMATRLVEVVMIFLLGLGVDDLGWASTIGA